MSPILNILKGALMFVLLCMLVGLSANAQTSQIPAESLPYVAYRDVGQAAVSKYPILAKYQLKSVVSLGAQPYKLEFWEPNDPGNSVEPRPEEIPMDSIGVQIFSDTVRPIDVLADVVSHYMRIHDPQMKDYYQQFVDSLTPEQKDRLKTDYVWAQKHEVTSPPPYDIWVQRVRLPAYFRGYTFRQWKNSFNRKVFTTNQIALFNKVRIYLGLK